MALKKDNLPVNVDVDTEQGSSITYAMSPAICWARTAP